MPKSQLRPNPHPAPGYARRAALRARPTMLSMGAGYSGKVLGTGPIAYWTLREESGAVARCLVNPAQNGTAVGVTWADALGPDGVNGAPFFDGANDFINIDTATFRVAFTPDSHTMMIWARVNDVGVWTDGIARYAFELDKAGGNIARLYKSNVAQRFQYYEVWGAAGGGFALNGTTETNWVCYLQTRSLAAGVTQAYYNGLAVGAPVATPNAAGGGWVDALLGASSSVPGNVWHGWLAHAVVWDRVLPPATIEALATV